MKSVELYLIEEGDNCTLYTLQFLDETDNEFEKFVSKFINESEYHEDYLRIAKFIRRILKSGAQERLFRREGNSTDSVVALPTFNSQLRLYCLRLSDKILILGNGGIKTTKTYEEDPNLRGYVLTLQKFEKLLNRGVKDGSVILTESHIETDEIFEL